jgi:hypothetical protein
MRVTSLIRSRIPPQQEAGKNGPRKTVLALVGLLDRWQHTGHLGKESLRRREQSIKEARSVATGSRAVSLSKRCASRIALLNTTFYARTGVPGIETG